MRDPVDQMQAEREGERSHVGRLKRRADFLRVGKGRRWHGKAVTVQAASRDRSTELERPTSEPTLQELRAPRVGFTLTKKVGCAVIRNRARRRLKEAVRLSPHTMFLPDADYVIVGRLDAIRVPFAFLREELARAVRAVDNRGTRREGKPNPKRHEAPATCVDRVNTRPEP